MAPGDSRANTGLTFFGMVGGVMAALKLKEKWNEYRRIPDEEDALGPLALHSPIDEDGMHTLDTTIPSVRLKRRKADCCVCCGMQCGLFWKAFGIVCLLLVGWQTIKFVVWMVTPSPTGLETMPKFSASLGCSDAPHLYGDSKTTFSVPINVDALDHIVDINGGAVGTLTIAEGAPGATEIKYEMTLRSSDASYLDLVTLSYSTPSEVEDPMTQSRMSLVTPIYGEAAGACMRYDMTVYVPPSIASLSVTTRGSGATQLKFDDDSNFDLGSLYVKTYGLDERNMILPHKGVHAGLLTLEMERGWLVGDVAIVDKTVLTTQRGDATLNTHVYPAPSSEEPPAVAQLQTTTGSGRSDIFYVNHPGHAHRQISSIHRSSRNGDLYLTYKEAECNGTVDLTAQSFSATGLQGSVRHGGDELPWVGSKDGADKIVAESPHGWVGIYF
ncbi:uncharacterized protein LAESUDRAFT_682490 [Laetiporus sulphureus 93-53]|uniref:Uncharacterized protein n=1 Tax=Laetiporus sulphureus 93-53 TaxID=1314785 RepID=A0A165DDM9_9APHY|nr:uncharacterized protein LAESUDRAFT_682490 [Laetiporus sulphureus 93-53]KZT04645.1 hypothetical protein LAESUDRAFT_682490 [Laetiporus sulphureus 93-53]